MVNVPRPEYPRPQMVRDSYMNLNGTWQCYLDMSNSGEDREVQNRPELFDREIIVPFCPESELSGIGIKDFIPSIYYRREILIPAEWKGRRIVMHFGGVDTISGVFVNGSAVCRHRGGMSGFSADLTDFVTPGEVSTIVVHAVDNNRTKEWGCGKQSQNYQSYACFYTRVTGIWQSVWMEAVAMEGFKRCYVNGDLENGAIAVTPLFHSRPQNCTLCAEAYLNGELCGTATAAAVENFPIVIKLAKIEPWEPGSPVLYDLVMKLYDSAGNIIDEVKSYAGLRTVEVIGNKIFLNGKELFLRFVLDQGYYPDGIWTAPSDEALKNDIILSMEAGFNGARLHQKVFEDRFHYWADKLGYLTWSESASWGLDYHKPEARYNFLAEWADIVDRLKDHPSIIAWSPLNEISSDAQRYEEEDPEIYFSWVRDIYDTTKRLDPLRPVNDASGWSHVRTDLWTVHPYRKDSEELMASVFPEGFQVMSHYRGFEVEYSGQPYLIDEFGGFLFQPGVNASGWGYSGVNVINEDEYCAKIAEQVDAMLADDRIAGYCYTQLTDVEQELNGVYFYDRKPKVSRGKLAKIFGKTR